MYRVTNKVKENCRWKTLAGSGTLTPVKCHSCISFITSSRRLLSIQFLHGLFRYTTNTRLSTNLSHSLPKGRTNYGMNNITFKGPQIWNSIDKIISFLLNSRRLRKRSNLTFLIISSDVTIFVKYL